MKTKINYYEIERRYQAKGDKDDKTFCAHCGICYTSYIQRRARKRSMNLLVALLIAKYLDCNITDFTTIN